MRAAKVLMLAAVLVAGTALAAHLPYDESANAPAQVREALERAAADQHPLLIIFGANWCPDCRALDVAMAKPRNAQLLAAQFVVVKVDVGNFDRNLELTKRYGDAIAGGIPAAAIVAPGDTLLYATHAGELANARHMSPDGVYEFFRKAADAATLKSAAGVAPAN